MTSHSPKTIKSLNLTRTSKKYSNDIDLRHKYLATYLGTGIQRGPAAVLSLHTALPVRSLPPPTPALSSAYRPLIYCSLYNRKKHQFPKFPKRSALSLAADLRWPTTATILIADYTASRPRALKA